MTRRGLILFLMLGVAWGIPYLLIKIAVGQLDPAMVVFSRAALAAVVLLPVAVARGEIRPLLRYWRPLLAYTVAELIVPQLLLGTAEERLPSSTTGLLIAAVPLAGVGVAFLMGRPERLSPGNWLGIVVGMAGVATLAGFGVSASDLGAAGEVLIVVACYALGPAVLSRWMPGLPATGVTAVALTVTALVYVPVVSVAGGWPSRVPSPSVLTSVVLLALVCSAAALTIMALLVAEIGPVRATAITYVNPAVALIAGAVVLAEPVTGWDVAGFVLILVGCFLVAWRGRRRAANGQPDAAGSAAPPAPLSAAAGQSAGSAPGR